MTSATDRMNGWPWNAFVGQKVIYVENKPFKKLNDLAPSPTINQIYTIRKIEPGWDGVLHFGLEEIQSWEYGAFRFRPVQTRDTSARVAEIKRLALGARDEVRA